ncbi:MAG: hypothetical protein KDM63_17940, partial [Verrucomicrobiae bacterium]|nr:hypothetical protein [Verrucomicrobiae bacterium]
MNKQQAIVFFGIILAGLGISLFTLNHFGKKVEIAENDPAPASPVQTEPAEPEPPAPKPKAEPKKSEPAPAPAPSGEMTFKSPEALMGALVDKIKNRDVNGFVAMAGEGAISPTIRPQVEGLLKDPAWAPNPETPISELAKSPDSVRWAIHFDRAPGAAPSTAVNPAPSDAATTELYADVVSSPDKSSWTVKKIALPFDFAAKTGLKPGNVPMPPGESNPVGTAPAPGATPSTGPAPMPTPAGPVDATDALTVAFAFSKAVIDRNFELARSLTDQNRVTDERVAALLIAVE